MPNTVKRVAIRKVILLKDSIIHIIKMNTASRRSSMTIIIPEVRVFGGMLTLTLSNLVSIFNLIIFRTPR